MKSSSNSFTIIIVDKSATLKTLTVKDYKLEELYKKCGFKKDTGFDLQVEWTVKLNGDTYFVEMYGKLDGKANMENKYDFPPPIDKQLYFGSCALVGFVREKGNDKKRQISMSLDLWSKIYDKLFGGFEDLGEDDDDEYESDELKKVPKHKKTKTGYLKDGFVVDDAQGTEDTEGNEDVEEEEDEDAEKEDDDDEEEDETFVVGTGNNYDLELEGDGSELSEESYV